MRILDYDRPDCVGPVGTGIDHNRVEAFVETGAHVSDIMKNEGLSPRARLLQSIIKKREEELIAAGLYFPGLEGDHSREELKIGMDVWDRVFSLLPLSTLADQDEIETEPGVGK